MPDFRIAEAYVQFSTKGDVTGATEKQQTAAERFNKRFIEMKKQNTARIEQFHAQEKKASEAVERFRQQAETQDKQRHQQRMARIAGGAMLTKQALGAIPGVGAVSDIAAAGAMGGPGGAAAMAAGKAISYGMHGAAMASPGSAERFQYQQDRLQAIIGSKLVPVIDALANKIEKIGDYFGGKGAQLGFPQFSGFAEARDRLQMLAARGLDTNGDRSPFEKDLGKNSGFGLGSRFGQWMVQQFTEQSGFANMAARAAKTAYE